MTSPYLDQPTRSLEEVRDELRARIANMQFPQPSNWLAASGPLHKTFQYRQYRREQAYLNARLAAVEAAIAERDKP